MKTFSIRLINSVLGIIFLTHLASADPITSRQFDPNLLLPDHYSICAGTYDSNTRSCNGSANNWLIRHQRETGSNVYVGSAGTSSEVTVQNSIPGNLYDNFIANERLVVRGRYKTTDNALGAVTIYTRAANPVPVSLTAFGCRTFEARFKNSSLPNTPNHSGTIFQVRLFGGTVPSSSVMYSQTPENSNDEMVVLFQSLDRLKTYTADVQALSRDTDNSYPDSPSSDYVSFTQNGNTNLTLPKCPFITSFNPTYRLMNTASFTLEIIGEGFDTNSRVFWDGTQRQTTYVSDTKVSISVLANELTTARSVPIQVKNIYQVLPGVNNPGQTITEESNIKNFDILDPNQPRPCDPAVDPTIGSLNPSVVIVGSGDTRVTATPANSARGFSSGDRFQIFNDATNQFDSLGNVSFNSSQLTVSGDVISSFLSTTGSRVLRVVHGALPGCYTDANLSVNNPVPQITALIPNSKVEGSPAFTLQITGNNFMPSSTVEWKRQDGGLTRNLTRDPAMTQTSNSLYLLVQASDLDLQGAVDVTVTNPAPGGGSATRVFTITPQPIPTITSVNPNPIARTCSGPQSDVKVTITGSNYLSTSKINFQSDAFSANCLSQEIPTTIENGSLVGWIPKECVHPIDNTEIQLWISNGSSISTPHFRVPIVDGNTCAPTQCLDTVSKLTAINPTSVSVFAADLNLTAFGTNFASGDLIQFGAAFQSLIPTTLNGTNLGAVVPTGMISTVGPKPVRVLHKNPNPLLADCYTNTLNLDVVSGGVCSDVTVSGFSTNPTPAISNKSFTITLTGTGFSSGMKVRINGVDYNATFTDGNPDTLVATIPANTLIPGNYTVAAYRPSSDCYANASAQLTVTAPPAPVITTLTPNSAIAGSPAFTLTIDGANFETGAVVRWNSNDRIPTTVVSATQITVQIPATDIASVGTALVTVRNPDTQLSNGLTFQITTPPSPSISGVNPNPIVRNCSAQSAQPIDISGSNFFSYSVVRIVSADCNITPAKTLDASGLHVTVPYSCFQTANQITVHVDNYAATTSFNVDVENGPSCPVTQCLINVATLNSIDPTLVSLNASPFTLSAQGTNLRNGDTIQFGASFQSLNPTAWDGSQLSATVATSLISSAGNKPVRVLHDRSSENRANCYTNSIDLEVVSGGVCSDVTVSGFSTNPSTVISNRPFTITLSGTGFSAGMKVRINGVDYNATFTDGNPDTLVATIPANTLIPGNYTVAAYRPSSDCYANASSQLTVNAPPPPVITLLTPSSAIAGSPAFTLRVDGSNFETTALIRWNGTSRPTNYVAATQSDPAYLTTQISASDIQNPGQAMITVINPDNQTSNGLLFQITAPPTPAISSVNPNPIVRNCSAQSAQPIDISGSNFFSYSVVRIVSADCNITPSKTLDGAGLHVTVPYSCFQTANQITVHVDNYAATTSFNVDVENGPSCPVTQCPANVADLDSINPTSVSLNASPFTLSAQGTNLRNGDTIQFGASFQSLNPTAWDGSQLSATVATSLISSAGNKPVRVLHDRSSENRANCYTNTLNLDVVSGGVCSDVSVSGFSTSPAIVISNKPFTITLSGTGFSSGMQVRINGVDYNATFTDGNPDTLVATIPANTLIPGNYTVAAYRPSSDCYANAPTQLTVTAPPAPVITTLTPDNAIAGSPAFTLTIDGANFETGTPGSVVRWNGNNRTPATVVSDTQITVQIPATDIAAVGTAQVTVQNPDTQISNAKLFQITAPPTPAISSVNPNPIVRNCSAQSAQPIDISGSNFFSYSVVRIVSADCNITPSKTLDGAGLHVTVPYSCFQTANQITVHVDNYAATTSFNVDVENGPSCPVTQCPANVADLDSINPTSVSLNASPFTLSAQGTNLRNGDTIQFGASFQSLNPTAWDGSQLSATVATSLISSAGNKPVRVLHDRSSENRANCYTNTLNLDVVSGGVCSDVSVSGFSTSPAIVISNKPFTITLSGTGFSSGMQVRINGVDYNATFTDGNPDTLVATIPANTLIPGNYTVAAYRPSSDCYANASAQLTVNAPPTIEFVSTTYETMEGNTPQTKTIDIEVRRTGVLSEAEVTLRTVNGSATVNDDFVALNQTVRFAENSSAIQRVTLIIKGDDLDEGDSENLQVELANETSGFAVTERFANITITDDDGKDPNIVLDIPDTIDTCVAPYATSDKKGALLTVSASNANDPSVTPDNFAYLWTKKDNGIKSIDGSNTRNATVHFLTAGTHIVEVKATLGTVYNMKNVTLNVCQDPNNMSLTTERTTFKVGEALTGFRAQLQDQFGGGMNDPISWTIDNRPVGSTAAGAAASFAGAPIAGNPELMATSGSKSKSVQLTIKAQFAEDNVANSFAFPVPWKKGISTSDHVTFRRLAAGAHIKIYTTHGVIVKELTADGLGNDVPWYLDNNSSEGIASGVYYYVITHETGVKKGKMVIIK